MEHFLYMVFTCRTCGNKRLRNVHPATDLSPFWLDNRHFGNDVWTGRQQYLHRIFGKVGFPTGSSQKCFEQTVSLYAILLQKSLEIQQTFSFTLSVLIKSEVWVFLETFWAADWTVGTHFETVWISTSRCYWVCEGFPASVLCLNIRLQLPTI